MVLTNLSTHRDKLCDKPALHDEEARVRDVPLVVIEQGGHPKITRCTIESYDVCVFGWVNSNDRREHWRKAISEECMLPFVVCALYISEDTSAS